MYKPFVTRGILIDVEIMCPDSVHDARVYANSQLNTHFTEKTLPTRGGGTRYIKKVGMLVENFEIDP